MKPIIAKMYDCGQPSYETIKDSKEYYENMQEFCNCVEDFKSGLTEKQKKVFEKLEDLHDNMEYESGLTRYVAGFKFGLKAGLEAGED